MILVGQFDSPFVRRVAVALNHYGMPFERRVLSVFQDFDAMLSINPLGKVPSLILADGEVIYDSRAILEVLEGLAPTDRRLTPSEPARHREMLRIEAVGLGLAEKTYERAIEFSRRSPGTQDPAWVARLERQIGSALSWLEALPPTDWLVGDRMTRAELAVTVATTYVLEKLPQLYRPGDFPRLEAQRRKCEGPPMRAPSE